MQKKTLGKITEGRAVLGSGGYGGEHPCSPGSIPEPCYCILATRTTCNVLTFLVIVTLLR
ncbi:hypothetical protein [Granulosicoccus antarcticus]|uniref:hypothetical protein n=1 Tax=Granulosicoccus antarcticus TaxID=437505 RepID=UPI000B5A2551|nr:hypothetical protein [Granulosicoccus antarcticus]